MSAKEKTKNDWSVDKYRTDYESEEHWQLRKKFMITHKDKFDEDRLVCLAQVFTNVEFMGCKYPNEVMCLVAELSKDVAKEFRKQRETKIKRTFISASDAAESRAKGYRTAQRRSGNENDANVPGSSGSNTRTARRNKLTFVESASEQQNSPVDLFEGLLYNEFILLLQGGRNCLRFSAQRANIQYNEKELGVENGKEAQIYIDDKLVSKCTDVALKMAKRNAFDEALKKLQKHCYTIQANPARDAIKIRKENNKVVCDIIKSETATCTDMKLDPTNKGYKIMKSMGWTGGGLGLKTQGREEPVDYLFKNNRIGLGSNHTNLNRQDVTQIFQNYINSDDIRELQFSSDFTKDERVILHEIAGKFPLKSTSYGKGEDRHLIISKKNISSKQILAEILINCNDSYIDQYLVQVPESKGYLFPSHTAKLVLDS
ncbi:uncharacterized protein LOC119679155 [Teleopsis dalmanni]|uniref:uncharacterized protein LOC119679155 n=1 Tax=Teleopsis dalmanni TaxID=139649 RepID=UPI0018CD1CE4|nr:uncharacterized protein LOC119679155 [Teleopsis dalmanni]